MPRVTPASGDEGRLESLWAGSIYGARTRQGLVELSHQIESGTRTWHVLITPDEARAFAASIVEAAEAAEQDAFLVGFLTTRVGLDLDRAVLVLRDFRAERDARRA
jgi:hypothetical protein